MRFYTERPSHDPNLHSQLKQTKVSDEEFFNLFEEPQVHGFKKAYQIFIFIITFGIVRFLLTFMGVLYFTVSIKILLRWKKNFATDKEFRQWAHKYLKFWIRWTLLFTGIIHINVKGTIDKTTRVFVSNHLTMVDIVSLMFVMPYSVVANAGLKNQEYIQVATNVFDMIFIDRSTHQHGTEKITEFVLNEEKLPLVIFPEGKVTNGNSVIGFRTGAFVSGAPVQPIDIRYRSWFIFPEQQTPCWLSNSILYYFFQLYSAPFMTLEIHILPQLKIDESLNPTERALAAQLAIANDLGTKAIDKNNKDYLSKIKLE